MANINNYNSYYDTNRIVNSKATNQKVNDTNTIYNLNNYQTDHEAVYDELSLSDHHELIKNLLIDEDFIVNYKEIKIKEKIIPEFVDLDNLKKIDIIIRIWFIAKNEKEKLLFQFNNLKHDYESRLERERFLSSQNVENMKRNLYSLNCENEQIKINMEKLRKEKEDTDKKKKELEQRITKNNEMKECFEKEKKALKSENIEIENYYQLQISKYDDELKESKDRIDSLLVRVSDVEYNNNLLMEQRDDFRVQYQTAQQAIADLEQRNKKLDQMLRSNGVQNYDTKTETGGMALGDVYLSNLTNDYTTNIFKHKEDNFRVEIPIDIQGISKINNLKDRALHSNINLNAAKYFLGQQKEEEEDEKYDTHRAEDLNKISKILETMKGHSSPTKTQNTLFNQTITLETSENQFKDMKSFDGLNCGFGSQNVMENMNSEVESISCQSNNSIMYTNDDYASYEGDSIRNFDPSAMRVRHEKYDT